MLNQWHLLRDWPNNLYEEWFVRYRRRHQGYNNHMIMLFQCKNSSRSQVSETSINFKWRMLRWHSLITFEILQVYFCLNFAPYCLPSYFNPFLALFPWPSCAALNSIHSQCGFLPLPSPVSSALDDLTHLCISTKKLSGRRLFFSQKKKRKTSYLTILTHKLCKKDFVHFYSPII